MENKELSPSESLALITKVILEAKSRFRDNGFSFIFLGFCSFIASLGQFILLQLGYYQTNYFPYFIMPVAGVITYFYYRKKTSDAKSKNMIGSLLAVLGIVLGINLAIAGFFFWNRFGVALIPFMLIIFSIWPLTTGVLIKNKFIMVAGLLINVIAYGSFFIDREFHPLVLSVVSLVGIVLPGFLLKYSRKEGNV